MFLTNNKKYYEKAILLSNTGRTDRVTTFWCDVLGYEYQMANVTAALITAQVERIEELVVNKRRIYDQYYKRLKDVKELQILKENHGDRANYCYPALLLKSKKISRDNLVQTLKKYNIHSRNAFPRMSLFPMYKARFKNPVATQVMKYGFNLPAAANLDEKDVNFVCDVLLSLI